jgi:hypothetical protein
MLAYVFWHWPAAAVDAAAYEAALVAFHRALAGAGLPGVRDSVACRVEGARWLGDAAPAYEDWYRVGGFADLGTLNEGAVSGACAAPHDAAARLAAGGTAGLYRLAAGDGGPPAQASSAWLAKPAGTSDAALFAALAAITGRPGVSLWQRQMTLGPAPEFCLLSPAPVALDPVGLSSPIRTSRRVVWPAGPALRWPLPESTSSCL